MIKYAKTTIYGEIFVKIFKFINNIPVSVLYFFIEFLWSCEVNTLD